MVACDDYALTHMISLGTLEECGDGTTKEGIKLDVKNA